ncbi:MAG: hypothetical protein WBIAU1_02050 [Wolbachia endosymbiont of Drosophila biauraria]|nr:MAG: hypothetical protein WBIAU1_02050 [Wolbachia endosymbiont of Drosophila biauraria]
MSKNNVELYFGDEPSDQSKLLKLESPVFTKPDFVKTKYRFSKNSE